MSPEWHVRRFDEIGSTNSYLLAEARRGAPDGVVAVARYQTAGRGRLDRRWESPPGANLLASVLLRPNCNPGELHLCTAAVALSAADACWEVAGVGADLKWPNDLLVGEAKLAGVLAEADFGNGPASVIVGIGMNVAWPGPRGAGGTCLDDLAGRPIDAAAVLDRLLAHLTPRRRQLDDATGRAALAEEHRRRCDTVGRRVRVTLPNGEVVGVARDIDADGHLVVDTSDGRRAVAAGDVVHVRVHPG